MTIAVGKVDDWKEKYAEMSVYENEFRGKGLKYIAGIDEAGRGPYAGPVCVAGVILEDGVFIEGLDDSKKLSEKKRELLYSQIVEKATAYSVAFVYENEIDEIGINPATYRGMRQVVKSLTRKPEMLLIDGNYKFEFEIPYMHIVKGDSKSVSIAAASILAKVSRDRYMVEISEKYPEYLFQKNKGYGSREHEELIEKYGICKIHRKSYLKKFLNKQDFMG